MGVTKLWNVLKNTKQDITLDDIKGKTLAVDLAAWICELENVKQTHCYLRNLFFRLSGVIKADIVLVFVLDGKPPELKWETISKRLDGNAGEAKKKSCVRSRLNAKLKECCNLFDSLGVPWIKAEGEAEALCAALNKAGLVDGVVTSDGDAFLYGAQTVYRNFSVEKRAAIERYCMEDIEKRLHLDQRGLIALGLLLGCDYCPKGVLGVGEAQAIKLLSSFHGKDALSIFSSWREAGCSTFSMTRKTKPAHCSACGHEGAKKDHFDSCCAQCGRNCADSTKYSITKILCQCDWHKEEEDRKKFDFEEKIRVLAIKDQRFPDKNIIREFLKSQKYVSETRTFDLQQGINLKKSFLLKPPKLDIACGYLERKANWTVSYSMEKVLPLLTHFLLSASITEETLSEVQIQLNRIVKKRVRDHIESLEVEWRLSREIGLKFDGAVELITVESEESLSRLFPDAVKKFYEGLQKQKEEKKAKAREQQKKNRKIKSGSHAMCNESRNHKVTDYFQTKKLRNEDKKVDEQGETDVAKVESALSHLSLTRQQLGDKVKQSQILEDNTHANTTVQCRGDSESGTFINSARPLIVFSSSSDSEDEDFDIGNIVNKISVMKIGERTNDCPSRAKRLARPTSVDYFEFQDRTIYKPSENQILNAVSENDITFSNDLDFSLGCSLLQTPVCEDKENKCPLLHQNCSPVLPVGDNCMKSAILHKADKNLSNRRCENKVSTTSGKKSCSHSEEAPCSPVFMTLMQRLKAREKM